MCIIVLNHITYAGLFVAVVVVLQLLDRSVPRKQKVGLLLGVSMNFFLSVVPKAVSD